jgi:hypothetical protein
MSTAQRVFIVYGTIILIVGFGLGTVLGAVRMKAPSVRNLATAHVETLLQGVMHLALAFAVGAVGFDGGKATAGAWLLVVSSAMQAFGVTVNWIQNVSDQFAQRSIGFYANSASTFASIPGLAIVAYGILSNI